MPEDLTPNAKRYTRHKKSGGSVHRPKTAQARVRPGDSEARRAASERASQMPRYRSGRKKGRWKKAP